jgi:hypothetical protein
MANQPKQMSAQDVMNMNNAQRAFVLAKGLNMRQIIDSRTLIGAPQGQSFAIPLKAVGLLKRLTVEVSFNIIQSAAETLTKTTLGPANIFSNIMFTDLSNLVRINVPGWYLTILATMRRGAAYGGVFTNDSPYGMGARNFNAMVCPTSVTNTVQTVRMFFEVPITYSDQDFRGIINLSTVNATAQLQLTVNQNLVVANTATDATGAVFQSSTAALGTISNFQVVTYQEYIDQIPPNMVPILDQSSLYNLLTTQVPGMTVGNDFPIYYGNQRQFQSTIAFYNNNGQMNPGTDVNNFSLVAANNTPIFKMDPWKIAMETRALIGDDMPPGMYYFDHRTMPIVTTNYGNMALNMNASAVGSATGSILNVGWEYFTFVNVATTLGSLGQT